MGALPALIWTADHPEEVAGLLYIEAPVMLGPVLRQVFAYTPQAMAQGSMWWWILPLAPGVPTISPFSACHCAWPRVCQPSRFLPETVRSG